MELRDHIYFLLQKKWTLFISGLLLTLISVGVLYLRPVQHEAVIAFDITLQDREETVDYQFDDYYAIKAAELVSDTIISWFMNPSVVSDVFVQANAVTSMPSSTNKLTRFFKVQKYSSQNLIVRFRDIDPARTSMLSRSAVSVIEDKSSTLNTVGDDDSTFQVVGQTPYIIEIEKPYLLTIVIAFIVGKIFGTVYVYMRRYLKK